MLVTRMRLREWDSMACRSGNSSFRMAIVGHRLFKRCYKQRSTQTNVTPAYKRLENDSLWPSLQYQLLPQRRMHTCFGALRDWTRKGSWPFWKGVSWCRQDRADPLLNCLSIATAQRCVVRSVRGTRAKKLFEHNTAI
jgi:hypothetical protein